jgi:hypothetical protein
MQRDGQAVSRLFFTPQAGVQSQGGLSGVYGFQDGTGAVFPLPVIIPAVLQTYEGVSKSFRTGLLEREL